MTDKIYLIPAAGLTIRDPITGVPLPPEGEEKTPSAYWWRRLRDGDVTAALPREVPTAEHAVTARPIARAPAKPKLPSNEE